MTEQFIMQKKEALLYLQAKTLMQTNMVRHCFSTRHGGVSEAQFASLNLGPNRGDDKENVLKNFEILCDAMQSDVHDIVFSAQEHTDNVQVVSTEHRGNGLFYKNQFQNIDALVTNEKNVTLSIFSADCVPILLFDPIKQAIGACHSGWRGTVQKIAKQTITTMQKTYGCNPTDILCAIGPSIGQCCFEVDQPVVDAFESAFVTSHTLIKPTGNQKFHIDLWRANRDVLLEAGVPVTNISIAEECTYCRNDLYFSHRYTKGNRGTLCALIALS